MATKKRGKSKLHIKRTTVAIAGAQAGTSTDKPLPPLPQEGNPAPGSGAVSGPRFDFSTKSIGAVTAVGSLATAIWKTTQGMNQNNNNGNGNGNGSH
jgi:hypothetical protein